MGGVRDSMSISHAFARHHQACDEAYVEAELAASEERWPEAVSAFERFRALMERTSSPRRS